MTAASVQTDRVVGEPPSALEAARRYTSRGWRVVPVPHGTKGPDIRGWQNLLLGERDLTAWFGGHCNIGVLLGDPSRGLVNVDLDCDEAVALADEYLPPTPSVTGRPSRRLSHRWYISPGLNTTQHRDPVTRRMIVELRSTGAQTLVGPSIHPCGEPYDLLEVEPACVPGSALVASVDALGKAVVRLRHGEPRGEPREEQTQREQAPVCDDQSVERRAAAYLASMPPAISGSGGHDQTYAAATALVHGFGLSPDVALRLLRDLYNPRCEPPWTERELRHKVDDAASKPHERPLGWLRDARPACFGLSHSAAATPRGAAELDPDGQRRVPTIVLSTDEHRVVDEAVAALAADPELFQRGNCLVRVVQDGATSGGIRRCAGSRWIEPLPVATLRERLTKFASIVRVVTSMAGPTEIPAHPPGWLVSAAAARGRWPGVRDLIALSDTPVLRPDGTLFQEAGFDEATGVLLNPSAEFPTIPDGITIDDADAAVASLLDVIGDFRFERPEHKSAFIAALLTPLARFAFDGPAPLFLFDANVRGAGKGLLVQVIGRIALGREIPVSSYSHDTEEMRKKITAAAIAGDRILNLDNLEGRLGNDALDRALTTTRWRDRILGKSEQVELPLHAVWFASGNNVAVAADTARRVIHIRLDVLEESPENRGDFKRPQLLAWVQANRARLLVDAMTILVAYCNAGRPSQGLPPFGSFEGWSKLVREAVVWAGLPDPCLTRTTLAESSDTVRDVLEQLIAAWRGYDTGGEGIVVPVLLATLYDRQHEPTDDASVAMRAALENLVGSASGRAPDARRVGNRLKSYRRRVVAGFFIDADPSEKSRMGAVWRLKSKTECEAL